MSAERICKTLCYVCLLCVVCRATSPGKLLHYLVDEGCHVDAGKPYAEIEVMKMVTTLCTTESGT